MPALSTFARRLLGASAVCSILAIASPARAGIIGSFDPAFGPTIPNLGFRGSITLDVTPGCFALGGGFHSTGGSCLVTAQSAVINYYNATTASGVLTTVSLPGSFFSPSYVTGVYIDPLTGQFAGLDTNDSAFFPVSVTDNSNPLFPISYAGRAMLLYFTSGFASGPIILSAPIAISSAVASPSASVIGVGGGFLVDCGSASSAAAGGCVRSVSNTSARAMLTFTVVPEPGSLALGLLGIVALAVSRRRTRRASA